MDRLKFRLWDKDIGHYFEKPYIFINTDGKLVSDDCVNVYEIDQKAYIVEQCTGLKDKNGKLIYEGDICRIKGTYYDCDYSEYFDVDEVDKVESLEKFFGEAMVKGIYSALGCDNLDVEVIGNIHTENINDM